MSVIIDIAKFVLNVIYCVFKLFPVKNKVLFLSRQSDTISIDYTLLIDELKKEDKLKIVVLTRRIGKGLFGKIKYAIHIFVQMYHIATSKVVIIDGYQIVVSVLKHKKDLKIIQMWHALGALKKFGYSIKDKKEGSSGKIIDKMNMHKNYTTVLSSSKIAAKSFAEAFNVDKSVIKINPLPRVDFLLSEKFRQETQNKIFEVHPKLKNGKKNILYVPTFRKNSEVNAKGIVDNLDYTKYNLILKLHHGMEEVYIDSKDNPIIGNAATGMEFIHVADAVITDYSAIAYEVAIVNKPIYFYVYDFEQYTHNRDFYLDFKNEMPGVISKNADEILKSIYEGIFYEQKEKEFVKRYIEESDESYTKKLAYMIIRDLERVKG